MEPERTWQLLVLGRLGRTQAVSRSRSSSSLPGYGGRRYRSSLQEWWRWKPSAGQGTRHKSLVALRAAEIAEAFRKDRNARGPQRIHVRAAGAAGYGRATTRDGWPRSV